jgi:hypothetical protein
LGIVGKHSILSDRVLSICVDGENMKNIHETKGGISNSIWSGKYRKDRPAAGMERIQLRALLADFCWRFLPLFATSSDGGAVIASQICPLETIGELWQRLFRRAEDQRGPGPAREMRQQSTCGLNMIEGLPAARLKRADMNSNGLETDLGK